MMISTCITSKSKSTIITQLSVIVHFEKKPQIYSMIPINPNIKNRDILYAADSLILSSNAIRTVVIIITIELRHILNMIYFDDKTPNKMLVINKQHPIVMILFMILQIYWRWCCLR